MEKMHRACLDIHVILSERICRLILRECAGLQGFDDTFIIPVLDSQSYKQLGNDVTVNVSYAVTSAVKTA